MSMIRRLGLSTLVSVIVSLPLFCAATTIVDPSSASRVVETGQLAGHRGAVYCTAWSSDGGRLATASSDGTARIWDAATGAQILSLDQGASCWGIAWSPDATRVVTVGYGTTIRVWDATSGAMLAELSRWSECAYCVAWSPNGALLAVGESDGTILILKAADLSVAREWIGHTGEGISNEVIGIAWSPDGARIASGGLDYVVRVWDAATGNAVTALRASTSVRNDINGVAWSPDGRRIAAAGQDGYVRIWDAAAGTEIRSVKVGTSWARGVAWSPDGKVLATTGGGGKVQLWDPAAGSSVAVLSSSGVDTWSVAFSPDGARLATGSGRYEDTRGTGTVKLWGIR